MVPGMIMLWHGAIVDIPSGWTLCDGTMGTPDLRDKFVRGAGGSQNPGDTGGSATHDHTFTGDSHRHSIGAGDDIAAGADIAQQTGFSASTGTTASRYHTPVHMALCYIMKL